MDVCADPAYGHDLLMDRVTALAPRLVEALSADRGRADRIAVTSLGPGDGSLDARVLEAIEDSVGVASYRALDFSMDLLKRAVNRISGRHGGASFPVEAICGDFTDLEGLRPAPVPPGTAHLFMLTGLTLGNYPEDRLLGRIGESLMAPGDYLVLDARDHGMGPGTEEADLTPDRRAAMTRSYDLDPVRRFVLGPVEVATTVAWDAVEIGYDITRGLTRVPGAWNVVIHTRKLEAAMRLTGEIVHRERLDLAVTTLYDPASLRDWFPSAGFRVVWADVGSGTAFFLLRRTESERV
jgi:SAM-dependent methyltransferase